MSAFEIKSEVRKGEDLEMKVYNRVVNPAAVFDKDTGTLLKIGEKDDMLSYYNHICNTYNNAGYPQMTQSIAYMDLPKDQDEIDKVFQITGYIKRLYERVVNVK